MAKKKVSSKLTKVELAALDFLIADAQEKGEKFINSSGMVGTHELTMVVPRIIIDAIRRFIGGTTPQGEPLKGSDVEKALEQLSDEVPLKKLIELRKHLKDIVK